jgi:hypothetical protein
VNTASLELCKELYELSGWGNHDKWEDQANFYWVQDGGDLSVGYKHQLDGYPIRFPAYDLGYLLRKLKEQDEDITITNGYLQYENWVAMQYMWYDHDNIYIQNATTPEDAACKLAIELWKAGVLK